MEPRYRVCPDWEQLPAGMSHQDVADVAVDSRDRVYLLTRMESRVVVFEPDGTFRAAWGEDVLSTRPHGITIGPDDTVYIVDEDRNTVSLFTTEGAFKSALDASPEPAQTGADNSLPDLYDRLATIAQGAGPFNKPTKLAVAPNGHLYVSDGYGNCRVHRFDPSGRLISSWGEPGTGPGQFHLPHSVAVAEDGRVLIADRENDRVQVFTADGRFLAAWTDFHRPAGLCIRHGLVFVAELSWHPGHRSWAHGLIHHHEPARMSVLDLDGRLLARWGGDPPEAAGNFAAPHAVAVDSKGDLYVAEVTFSDLVRRGLAAPDCHTFLKLARMPV